MMENPSNTTKASSTNARVVFRCGHAGKVCLMAFVDAALRVDLSLRNMLPMWQTYHANSILLAALHQQELSSPNVIRTSRVHENVTADGLVASVMLPGCPETDYVFTMGESNGCQALGGAHYRTSQRLAACPLHFAQRTTRHRPEHDQASPRARPS